ncbi:hypothetical protein LS70_001970 [Helicobacter sp. MIT 11-5569]|uniref:hypothetical protein n=1 Tax=Helicobacter sp. MIT 11-5569 TaxID=1548151 RepID=UPI00051FDC50|nr:hypothetical protein [Helicobacter sp. MIT 11-5569]TLD85334.1 hypothetical protein LS70_001970 [Helicobacter sp. MIT 11-5569]
MLVFGDTFVLESFKIPPILYGTFSVFGVNVCCNKAIEYAYKQLCQKKRVENLVLINPSRTLQSNSLEQIQNFGSKIYCFVAVEDFKGLQEFAHLRKVGLVFCYKSQQS